MSYSEAGDFIKPEFKIQNGGVQSLTWGLAADEARARAVLANPNAPIAEAEDALMRQRKVEAVTRVLDLIMPIEGDATWKDEIYADVEHIDLEEYEGTPSVVNQL